MTVEELQSGIIIPIDKPRQWTSFQVVNKIKSLLRNRFELKNIKIGHAGTLDPLASGLLLVCIGKATKQIEQIQNDDKEYTGTIAIGATTPCYDLEQPIDAYYDTSHITMEMIQDKCKTFVGDIEQTPPLFSAVKIDGQRAYQYARNDMHEVCVRSKMVHVEKFNVHDIRISNEELDNPVNIVSTHVSKNTPGLYKSPQGKIPNGLILIDFAVECGKGTYIRSIARDLGRSLNNGAFLASLQRTRIGEYTLSQSYTLEQVDNLLQNNSLSNTNKEATVTYPS